MSFEPEAHPPADEFAEDETRELVKSGRKAMRVITWFSVGMAVAALGIYVGNELRGRAKFKRRTPYDFYSKPGEQAANEFGVGI